MKSVLIVDDSRTTRNYHSAILGGSGYRVHTANDGSEALERLLLNPCDLILTDINMQGMDGYEFIRRVRATTESAAIPIVIVSTDGQDSDKSKGYAAGANLYIVKPSDPTQLLQCIRMLLREAP